MKDKLYRQEQQQAEQQRLQALFSDRPQLVQWQQEGSADDDVDEDQEDPTAVLKKTLDKERRQRKAYESNLRKLEEKFKDVDPDEYIRLKDAVTTTTATKDEEVGQYKAKLKGVEEKAAAEITKWKSEYFQLKTDFALQQAFRKAGGRDDEIDDGLSYQELLLMAARKRVRMDGDELVILDSKGEETSGTLADLMEEFSKKGATAECFKPRNVQSGTSGRYGVNRSASGVPTGKKLSKQEIIANYPAGQRDEVAKANGIDLYK